MRGIADWFILLAVEIWVIATAFDEWRLLRRRMRSFGVRRVRVAAPRLADEKSLWRKLFDHDPRFIILSDKIACKEWIAAQGIDAKMPDTLWVGTDANEIPEDVWAQPFYLKASHGWQMNIPVLSPPKDRTALIEEANGFVAKVHGQERRQWAYAHVPQRLLAETALFPGQDLIEIKYQVFGGLVEQFVLSRHGSPTTSGRWQRQADGSFKLDDQPTTVSPIIDTLPLPPATDEGLRLASAIGSSFDQLRVDTMTDGETVYLGELTVYNQGGRAHLQGHYAESPWNRSWDLRKSWFMRTPQKGWRGVYQSALRRRLDACTSQVSGRR